MASTSLEKTFGQVGNRQTWTFSAWIKRAGLGTGQNIFSSFPQSTDYQRIMFNSSDKLYNAEVGGGATAWEVETDAVYRDTSAWYHLVLRQDTTEATADNRVRIYINNVQQTFGTNTQPAQNRGTQINTADVHKIGKGDTSEYFDGEMSHIHWCDGQSYAPTEFGEYDANGVWKIITEPSVTYGTNGFFILENGNSVTDQSGNGNNWTVAGGTLTNTEDSPSNVFCTMNALSKGSDISMSNGNTTVSNGGTNNSILGTLAPGNGKYYWEAKCTSASTFANVGVTLASIDGSNHSAVNAGRVVYENSGNILREGLSGQGNTSTGITFTTNDIIGVAFDTENGTLTFYKNGTLVNTTTDSDLLFSNNEYIPCSGLNSGGFSYNFGNGYFGTTAVASAGTNASGNGIFEYDVPTGYTALSTTGLNL